MGKTMLNQLATNRALYDAVRSGNQMGNVSAIDALRSAALIQRQMANADGYSYRGGSYGSFITKDDTAIALESSLILQNKPLAYTAPGKYVANYHIANGKNSYSYTGGSYGQFIVPTDRTGQDSQDAMYVAQVIGGAAGSGNVVTTSEKQNTVEEKGIKAFLKKYKLWVIATVCTVLYFVLRKK